jgi:hypothetical protein
MIDKPSSITTKLFDSVHPVISKRSMISYTQYRAPRHAYAAVENSSEGYVSNVCRACRYAATTTAAFTKAIKVSVVGTTGR